MGLTRWVIRVQKQLNNRLLEVLCNAIPSRQQKSSMQQAAFVSLLVQILDGVSIDYVAFQSLASPWRTLSLSGELLNFPISLCFSLCVSLYLFFLVLILKYISCHFPIYTAQYLWHPFSFPSICLTSLISDPSSNH